MTWPSAALAEVMDKETVSWSPARVLATSLATGVCAVLIRKPRTRGRRWVRVTVATAIALASAIAGAFDDFFSPDVGPTMRVELGRLAAMYLVVLLLESAAPLLAVLVLGARGPGRRAG